MHAFAVKRIIHSRRQKGLYIQGEFISYQELDDLKNTRQTVTVALHLRVDNTFNSPSFFNECLMFAPHGHREQICFRSCVFCESFCAIHCRFPVLTSITGECSIPIVAVEELPTRKTEAGILPDWIFEPRSRWIPRCFERPANSSIHCGRRPCDVWLIWLVFAKIWCKHPRIELNRARRAGGWSKFFRRCRFRTRLFLSSNERIHDNFRRDE